MISINSKQILTVIYFLTYGILAAQSGFEYVSPKPNAVMVSRLTNIIFRRGDVIDASSLTQSNLLSVKGSKSGIHEGKVILADDNKTVLFIPANPFEAGEDVTVNLYDGIRNLAGNSIGGLEFNFTITKLKERINAIDVLEKIEDEEFYKGTLKNKNLNKSSDSIPSDFPEIIINSIDNPAPGYIFLTVSKDVPGIGNYNMILDNNGKPVKYFKEDHYSYDFKVQKNNLFSYADIRETHWFAGGGETTHKILDTNLTIIDSFKCGNGYEADSHDFQLLPNGHALLFAYDLQPVDMSKIIEGGNPAALIAGSIIQEIDSKKNVVFEWRSWDYIPVTDSYQNLTLSGFDYIHVNSIEPDFDGNILISCRQTSEIIKINRTTGNIMWRMGGKKNQFTFINENSINAPDYFCLQHSFRRLENGNVILFDNGNFHSPKYSRAVEYKLDEEIKTATLVWEYRHIPDIFGASRGSVQRLSNGNTLIGWGSYSETKNTAVTEVTPDKKVVFELSLPTGLSSYRAFRFPYRDKTPEASVSKFDLLPLNVYTFKDDKSETGIKIKFSVINMGYNSLEVIRHKNAPVNPVFPNEAPITSPIRVVMMQEGIDDFKADIRFDNSYFENIKDPQNIIIYFREKEGFGTFNPLPTFYDNINQEIIASIEKFGEFIICHGYPSYAPAIPLLISPANNDSINETIPLQLRWTSRGYAEYFSLQVSEDSMFNKLIVDEPNVVSSIYTINTLLSNKKYYWRVKTGNSSGESDFSNTGIFYSIQPYIKVTYPNGGEILSPGKDYYIQWTDNIPEYVRIKLINNNNTNFIIADSISSYGSYTFSIPSDFQTDSTYFIEVSSIINSSISDRSDDQFSIKTDISGIDDAESDFVYCLEQNYPNPFNPSTKLTYSIPFECMVELKIFNSLGELIESAVSRIQNKGIYEYTFNAGNAASGIYFYTLNASPLNGDNSLRTVKKMILMK